MQTKWLTIPTADGPMHAYLATPDGAGPYNAILVLQEAFGVNHYVRSVVERLADVGYVALAPELFHRSGTHDDVAAVRAALDKSRSRHEVVVYAGAQHGFHTEDRKDRYDPNAAEQAWHKTLAWLGDMLR